VAPRKISVPSEHGALSRRDRIAALLAEMEREVGPIDPQGMEEVRQLVANRSGKERILPAARRR